MLSLQETIAIIEKIIKEKPFHYNPIKSMVNTWVNGGEEQFRTDNICVYTDATGEAEFPHCIVGEFIAELGYEDFLNSDLRGSSQNIESIFDREESPMRGTIDCGSLDFLIDLQRIVDNYGEEPLVWSNEQVKDCIKYWKF